jgi:acyl-coenzyme A synthetase/AMP-(fatty) acid ligase/thioesterase domain-containing protein/acyl carrier protein
MPTPPDQCLSIPELFEKRAEERPDQQAVTADGQSFCYADLNATANRIARTILKSVDGRRKPVAVLQGHDGLAVASILGILKAGHVVTPLGSGEPEPYLRRMMSVAQPAALLGDAGRHAMARRMASASSVPLIPVEEGFRTSSEENLEIAMRPGDPCYLLFTSGSTGIPKAVVDTHERILNDTAVFADHLRLAPEDRLAWLGPYTLGAQTLVIFGALLEGATLCPYPLKIRGLGALPSWTRRQAITILSMTPSAFRAFANSLDAAEAFPSLRRVVMTGEPLHRSDVELFRRHFRQPCEILNVFGLTEQKTVGYLAIDHAMPIPWSVIPVRPHLRGQQIGILDGQGREVAAGEKGELVITSPTTTPGYWDRGAIRRPSPPFDDCPVGRPRYRTGDLAFFDEEGRLHLAGRRDLQVKIRGYRVEIEQVERALLEHEGLHAAAATGRRTPGGEDLLAAFYVCRPGRTVTPEALRGFLTARLPEHMVPARLLPLAKLPMTGSGKVDRGALPALPPLPSGAARPDRESPDPIERRLLTLWREHFSASGIGVHDSFFDLGGDSLAAAVLFAEIEESFGRELPLSTLLHAPTVARLARILRSETDEGLWPVIVPLRAEGSRPVFYCIPGAGRDPISLRDLCGHLDGDQPVHAFQPIGVREKGGRNLRVEEIASAYAGELPRQPAGGALLLGGVSFGGLVAFEMALQITARKRPVDGLILIDTYGPGYPRPRGDLNLFRRSQLRILKGLRISDRARPDLALLKREIAYRRRLYGERLGLLRSKGRRDTAAGKGYFDLLQRHLAAAESYTPAQRFDGRTFLLRTRQEIQADLYEPNDSLGWRRHARNLEVVEIPGRHTGLVRGSHVRAQAGKLQQVLDRILASCRSATRAG